MKTILGELAVYVNHKKYDYRTTTFGNKSKYFNVDARFKIEVDITSIKERPCEIECRLVNNNLKGGSLNDPQRIGGGRSMNGGDRIGSGNLNSKRETVTTNLGNVVDITPSSNHSILEPGSNPFYGNPNSSVDIYNNKGHIARRWFDENGEQYRDVDFTDHGRPKYHPEVPHEHGARIEEQRKRDEIKKQIEEEKSKS